MSSGSIPRPRKTNAQRRTTSTTTAAALCRCEPLERRLCLAITFASPTTYTLPSGTFTGTGFALGDFNRDNRTDAVMASWRVVGPIVNANTPVSPYAPGSVGPVEAERFLGDAAWHNPE